MARGRPNQRPRPATLSEVLLTEVTPLPTPPGARAGHSNVRPGPDYRDGCSRPTMRVLLSRIWNLGFVRSEECRLFHSRECEWGICEGGLSRVGGDC
ncbi:hypothetical protein AVEN_80671-1 [Araneus ventricosus]|uniref:Uncharacterized protein n=1 Tax=Araneus ventricosus TaxID=182803 RepID=A0A4Y2PCU2_ARAVE|nr:hypothetical protein AVEN_80671-1 [Araneus ventricosus]